MSNSLIKESRILLCHCVGVVFLVEVLLPFVEVDQFLVQRLIEQLKVLQTSLDIAVFPEPIVSSADVTQRSLDFVAAERLPSVVHEDSVLYVSHVLARLVSILLKSLPSPKFSLIFKSVTCFRRKSR